MNYIIVHDKRRVTDVSSVISALPPRFEMGVGVGLLQWFQQPKWGLPRGSRGQGCPAELQGSGHDPCPSGPEGRTAIPVGPEGRASNQKGFFLSLKS